MLHNRGNYRSGIMTPVSIGEPELDSLVPANRFTLAGSGYVQVEALTAPYFSAA